MIMARIVLLNGLPLNAFEFTEMHLVIRKVGINAIQNEINYYTVDGVMPVISNFIRHPATVQLLTQKLGIPLQPNSGLYSYMPNDIIFIITLNAPQRGQDVLQINESDISIYKVQIITSVR
jgi:hypothetical protein